MRKFLLPLFLLFCSPVFATSIVYPTTWAVNDTVTNTKLNNNNNAVSNVVNGSLDNTNMATGYSLFQTVSTLPTAGTQGRVDFLTTDSSLNLDTGATWVKTITPSGTLATGQVPYYNAGWQLLTPGAQYYSLISNGVSSLPSYQQVNLANGVTSILPQANGGTGAASFVNHAPQLFISNGTFTAPTGVTKVYLTMCGGGANGADSVTNTRSGGGGGAGACIVNFPYTVIAGNNYNVVIGGAGSASTFDATVSVAGGNSASGATGGIASTTTGTGSNNSGTAGGLGGVIVLLAGAAGGNGQVVVGSSGGGGGGGTIFGAGGAGGIGASGAGTMNGLPATANTGAGGGGGGVSGTNNGTGGAGGSGIVMVAY